MLGEGVSAGFEHMGISSRTVCYVEREAPAAAQLVTLMEAGALASAPIWSDMLTFDGRRWRGAVDCVAAGFPCQDLSIAGRRAGLNGKRSGLFFRVVDIADDCGAWLLVLENVAGIASATASVVDEEEGELEERAVARVLGELADRGWNAEWVTLRASDVGANHGRARWFCIAWRDPMAHAERAERGPERIGGNGCIEGDDRGRRQTDCGLGVAVEALGNAASARCEECGQCGQCGQCELSTEAEAKLHHRPEFSGIQLAHATRNGRHEGRTKPAREQRRPDAAECRCSVADTSQPGLSLAEQRVFGSARGGA